MSEMKEGDVFRWRYKPEHLPNPNYTTAYWCKSQIAMFKGGMLGDIYWGKDDLRFIRENEVDLTHIGNLDDYEVVPDYKAIFFDAADIMNLRHPNQPNAPLLLRKGAKRSHAATIAWCQQKIEDAEREKRWAENRIAELTKAIADVEAGKIDELLL